MKHGIDINDIGDNIYIYIYTHTHIYLPIYIFFIHSSINGYLGCFHVLAIVNSVAENIAGAVYIFELEFSSFPDICPGVGSLDHMVALFLVFFKEPLHCSL